MKKVPEENHFDDFEGDAHDVLYEVYHMLRDRGYSHGDLAPLREIIITDTHYDVNSLVNVEEADWITESWSKKVSGDEEDRS